MPHDHLHIKHTTAFWWTAAIFAAGGIICGTILRWGPLTRQAEAGQPDGQAGQRHMARETAGYGG